MENLELDELAIKMSFNDIIKLQYFHKRKDFNSKGWIGYMNSGKFFRLIKLYYSEKKELINYLIEKEEEVNNILVQKNIENDISFKSIAIKLFENYYMDENEYIKYKFWNLS